MNDNKHSFPNGSTGRKKENMNLYEIDYYDKFDGEKKTATATGGVSYEAVKDFVFRRKGNVLITDIRFVCSYDEFFDRK